MLLLLLNSFNFNPIIQEDWVKALLNSTKQALKVRVVLQFEVRINCYSKE